MAGVDYYKILGVPSTATAEEIKSAHRELIKKHHPDLYTASLAKEQATQKLQEINEAYAALGNPERRREYDRSRVQVPPRSGPRQAKRATRSTASAASPTAKPVRKRFTLRKKMAFRWNRASSIKLAASLVGVIVVTMLAHAVTYEPRAATAWALLEKTAVEPPPSAAGEIDERWHHTQNYASRAECSAGLKERVGRDEREGSKVIFDEKIGTVAITVYVRDVSAVTREYVDSKMRQRFPEMTQGDPQQQRLAKQQLMKEAEEFVQKTGVLKRVRNYECRAIQVVEPEPWLRRQLRRMGVFSW